MRKLETGRYRLAMDHLSESLRQRTRETALRRHTQALKARTGTIRDVRGEPAGMGADQAEADAVLTVDEQRTTRLRFVLTREQGLWRIQDLGELDAGRQP